MPALLLMSADQCLQFGIIPCCHSSTFIKDFGFALVSHLSYLLLPPELPEPTRATAFSHNYSHQDAIQLLPSAC